MSANTRTLHFADEGQDFLEWDIDRAGVVIESRPCQSSVWAGFVVTEIQVGKRPMVDSKLTGRMRLNHAITRITSRNPWINTNGYGSLTVEDRIRDLQQFSLDQCRAALEVPDLQRTVEQRLRSRIRKLELQAVAGGDT